jgi:hypothetical protein
MPGTTVHGLTYPLVSDAKQAYPAIEQINYGLLDAAAGSIFIDASSNLWVVVNAQLVGGVWKYVANGIATAIEFVAASSLNQINFYSAVAGVAGASISWVLQFQMDVSGGFIALPQLSAAPGAPSSGFLNMYVLPGTVSGQSLRIKGASGNEAIIMDNV